MTTDPHRELLRQLRPDPDPYDALRRVLALPRHHQRNLLRLTVWCEQRKHSPVRIFEVREGMLVQCRSDADARDMQAEHPHMADWSRRRAFFLAEWLAQPPDVLDGSHLQVVCDCEQTRPRLIDVRRLAAAAEDDATRNVTVPAVSARRG